MRREGVHKREEHAPTTVRQHLAQIAPMSLLEFLCQRCFDVRLVVRECGRGDEKRDEQHRPRESAAGKDECPHNNCAEHAAGRERAAPIGECGNDKGKGKTESE